MKKTLAAAITSAIVIGAASTTFAAANPFSDVPTDHWSFDAVAKLAQEGVIEGYGDNTFRGDSHITRYEMAQMVAKAMAKDLTGSDKATVDKLAAEYANELNNLGVRVANLEKKSDNVKFTGLMRIDGTHREVNDVDNGSTVKARVRLDMTAFVNDDWTVKSRLEADTDLDNGAKYDEKVTAKRIYAEGPLFGSTVKLGKFGGFDNRGLTTGGLLLDNPVSGAEFTWKSDRMTTALALGRLEGGDYDYASAAGIGTSDYAALQLEYGVNDKFKIAAGYHNLNNSDGFMDGNSLEDNNSIWTLGFDYKLNNDLTFGALYAGSNNDAGKLLDSDEETAYTVQLTYKGVKQDVPNSYGLWVAYRQIGQLASMHPTYDGAVFGDKGVEFGAQYMIDKNIMLYGNYFNGERITGGQDVESIFGRVQFSF